MLGPSQSSSKKRLHRAEDKAIEALEKTLRSVQHPASKALPGELLAAEETARLLTQRLTAVGPVRLSHVVYINLDRRPDRRLAIERELCRAQLTENAHRLAACSGADIAEGLVTTTWDSTLNAMYDKKTVPHRALRLSCGERGCAGSHLLLWAEWARLDDSAPPLLVLEDDVLLAPAFKRRAAALIDALELHFAPAQRSMLLYLCGSVSAWREAGGLSLRVPAPPSACFVLREVEYLWETAAYVIWPAAARVLLAHLPISAPVDVHLACLIRAGTLRAWAPTPQIAKQAAPMAEGDILHTNVFKPHVYVSDSLRSALNSHQRAIDPDHVCGGKPYAKEEVREKEVREKEVVRKSGGGQERGERSETSDQVKRSIGPRRGTDRPSGSKPAAAASAKAPAKPAAATTLS